MELKVVNGDGRSSEEVLPLDARGYSKSELLIDNIKKVYHSLYIRTGFAVSIDQTINNSKGIPKEYFWMNNNPVKEGYKLW